MTDSTVMKYLKANYQAVGLDIETAYDKTALMLKVYRKVSWCTDDRFEELNEITCEECMGDYLTYLFHFAPEKEMEMFRHRAISAAQSRAMLGLVKEAIIKMKDFPIEGQTYYSIIDLKYLNCLNYNEEKILEQLDLQRSTYYRKKKEAVLLLGFLLFGLCAREFEQT